MNIPLTLPVNFSTELTSKAKERLDKAIARFHSRMSFEEELRQGREKYTALKTERALVGALLVDPSQQKVISLSPGKEIRMLGSKLELKGNSVRVQSDESGKFQAYISNDVFTVGPYQFEVKVLLKHQEAEHVRHC